MFTTIEIPHFSLQSQFRENPALALRPCALLDDLAAKTAAKDRGKARVLQVTPSAAARGIGIGMTATQAQARCPEITLLTRSPAAEAATRDLLHALAGAYTPDFEDTAEGICTLDLFANPSARHRHNELGHGLVGTLAGENLRARVGFAETPDLALLAAKLARPTHVVHRDDGSLRAFLDPLPLEVLAPSAALLEVLHLWGIRTLGELIALPAEELSSRLGEEAKALHSRARGGGRRLLKLVRPPTTFEAEHHFEHRVETLEPLGFALRRLLESICSRLAAAYRVAGSLTLTLKFDNGSAKARAYRIPDASADIDLLARIVQTGLETEKAPAPVVGMKLAATPARAARHQFKLFESSLRDPHRFAETLARLEALLGGGRVGSPTPADTHRPDTFAVTPYQAEAPTSTRLREAETNFRHSPFGNSSFALGLPLRRFRPPLPVEVALLPDGDSSARPAALLAGPVRGQLTETHGPWRNSGDWWQRDTRWARQEWDVQLADDGGLYRLVHSAGKWFLDGEYG